MRSVQFSFIVPTHNSSKFVSKLLDCVPVREDIEVIVIDDHSKDYVQLKRLIERHVLAKKIKLLQNTGTQSAGTTRNVGLRHAVGKWIIFADSDDYLTPELDKMMNKYRNSRNDIVIFEPKAVMVDTGEQSDRADYVHYTFSQYDEGRIDAKTLSYRLTPIWSKFYRRDKVRNIRFEASLSADDILFSIQAAFATRNKIAVDRDHTIYVVTERSSSVTKNKFKSVCKLFDWYIIRMRADRWLVRNVKAVNETRPSLARNKSLFRKFFIRKVQK